MNEPKNLLKFAGVRGLSFPVKVASKYYYLEQCTVATINMFAWNPVPAFTAVTAADRPDAALPHARRENPGASFPYIPGKGVDLEKDVLELVNECEPYSPVTEVTGKLVKYINSLNVKTASVNVRYPFFSRSISPGMENYIVKYQCRQTVKKLSLINYSKCFAVTVPVKLKTNGRHYLNNHTAGPEAVIIVEAEGFAVVFTEDIIESVKRALNRILYPGITGDGRLARWKSDIAQEIEHDMRKRYDVEKCNTRIIVKHPLPKQTAVRAPQLIGDSYSLIAN